MQGSIHLHVRPTHPRSDKYIVHKAKYLLVTCLNFSLVNYEQGLNAIYSTA